MIPQQIYISHDSKINSGGLQAVTSYFLQTAEISAILSAMFEVFFPDIFKKFQSAFQAGKWWEGDQGPWLGRAIVYKLQVYPHFDPSEAGPTASFPCGWFEGGRMCVPQLMAAFL